MKTEDNLSYGKIKNKDIGNIYLGTEDGQNPAAIVNVIKVHKAIILDIRQNTGGDDRYAARICGAFADSEKIIYTVQTRNEQITMILMEKIINLPQNKEMNNFLNQLSY